MRHKRAAVVSEGRFVEVLAGPGSGKVRAEIFSFCSPSRKFIFDVVIQLFGYKDKGDRSSDRVFSAREGS
jgi:hypothetical protein